MKYEEIYAAGNDLSFTMFHNGYEGTNLKVEANVL